MYAEIKDILKKIGIGIFMIWNSISFLYGQEFVQSRVCFDTIVNLTYYNTGELAMKDINCPAEIIEYYAKSGKLIGNFDFDLQRGTFVDFFYQNEEPIAIQTISKYDKEGNELTTKYALDGSVKAEGIYRDEEPYEGTFIEEKSNCMGTVTVWSEYKKGQLRKKIIYEDENMQHILAEGTYRNGKPYRGTFIKTQE